MEDKMENPWDIQSIYEFQYFNCPSCSYKNQSKQEFVNHAYDEHPDSVSYLSNLVDVESFRDIDCPWDMKYTKFQQSLLEIPPNEEFQDINKVYLKSEPIEDETDSNIIDNDDNEGITKNEFKCKKCEKTFGRSDALRIHIAKVHKDPKTVTKYKCDKCDKSYTQGQWFLKSCNFP